MNKPFSAIIFGYYVGNSDANFYYACAVEPTESVSEMADESES